jgi:hypothetical protein
MSREWFQITKHPLEKPRRDAFADPLEGEEWRGLGWAVPLLSRVTEGRRPMSRAERQVSRVATERHPANA